MSLKDRKMNREIEAILESRNLTGVAHPFPAPQHSLTPAQTLFNPFAVAPAPVHVLLSRKAKGMPTSAI